MGIDIEYPALGSGEVANRYARCQQLRPENERAIHWYEQDMLDIARHMTLKEVKRLMRDANDRAADVQRQLDDERIQYALKRRS